MKIKICCISSIEEARLAVDAGADALGLVSAMPSGPGVIDENLISEIIASVPEGIETFLLTSQVVASNIIDQVQRLKPTTVQLVDEVAVDELRQLCQVLSDQVLSDQALSNIKIVQVIHVDGEESIERAQLVAPHVNALLLDSGNQKLPVKELGGTGRTHDWSISRKIVEAVDTPVFLAGGLNPENVSSAIAAVEPYGVDLCSGVRSGANLDKYKLMAFINAVRSSAADSIVCC